MENDERFRVVKIGFFKKVWLSITKFERYPEMATEGVGRAFSYLLKLMLIFCFFIVLGMLYNFNNTLKSGISYIEENLEQINFENEKLEIIPKNGETININTDMGKLIVDTREIDVNQINEYENNITVSNLGIAWLQDKVIVNVNGVQEEYEYKDILPQLGITNFNKTDLVNFLNNSSNIYISYFIIMFISMFITYTLLTILDVLMLSIFGLITSLLLKIRMRYRAVFNMSVYALTISIILKFLYIFVNLFVSFNIKYFGFMYSAIGYICLMASIFMIKSDVIKRQMELIKIMNEKNKQQEEQEKQEEDKNEEPKEEDKKEGEKEKKEENKDEKEPGVGDAENQGSGA